MSEPPGDRPIPPVIFSPDGKPPPSDRMPDPEDVTKIVIGQLPENEEAAGTTALTMDEIEFDIDLEGDLAKQFPKLTHLHLWRIGELKTLGKLPPGLKCLDVRYCGELEAVPGLPERLETLDIAHCKSLRALPKSVPATLERFYFNDCGVLTSRSLENFLEGLGDAGAPLAEIDGSGCPAVTSLEWVPSGNLKKLVLKGCGNLSSVAGVENFPILAHLDLGGCTGIESLPGLPPKIRYLILHGATNLKRFARQDIGPYEQGTEGENVAGILKSRLKFGDRMGVFPYGKLLLMGDGRVGKITLARQLQWEEMNAGERDRRPGLEPDEFQGFTHSVEFMPWETGFSFSEDIESDLVERAAACGATVPRTDDGRILGSIRIWDFGGQELYHTTHRIFAREGSVFLLAWCVEKPDPGPCPNGVDPEEWEEWNGQHSLDYWLDYIFSIQPEASVAVVCTKCENPDGMVSKPAWEARAPRNANDQERKKRIAAFHVNSLDPGCGAHRSYCELVDWLRVACGEQAAKTGILQPAFFGEVSEHIDKLLAENRPNAADAGLANSSSRHYIDRWNAASGRLNEWHRRGADMNVRLEQSDIDAITSVLHDAGQIYRIRQGDEEAVLIDQEWAAERIYELLLPGGMLRRFVKRHAGWFFLAELEDSALWKGLDDDLARTQLLAFMLECELVARLAGREESRLGQEVYLATDKWLLPEYISPDERKDLDRDTTRASEQADSEMNAIAGTPGMVEREKFAFEEIEVTQFDFRALLVHLAGLFGVRATYFRNGLQAGSPDGAREWCFRLRWRPRENDADAFTGTVDVVLVAPKERIEDRARRIEEIFGGAESPLADRYRAPHRARASDFDLHEEFFLGRKSPETDLGLSSSGGDGDAVEKMRNAMKAADYRVRWYRAEEYRLEDKDEDQLRIFMQKLLDEERMMLVLSDRYLKPDPAKNWYCAWELADAIVRLGSEKRSAIETLVILLTDDQFGHDDFRERIYSLLTGMEEHFRKLFAAKYGEGAADKFSQYDLLCRCFKAALEDETFNTFVEQCGPDGKAWDYANISNDHFAPLIDKLGGRIGGARRPRHQPEHR